MNFDAFLPWIASVALLSVRLNVAVALSPALSGYGVPATVRVALTVVIAVSSFAFRAPLPGAEAWVLDPLALVLPVLAEVMVGALIGLGVHLVLASFALAGRLLDVQIGFGIGSIFDPVARTNSNVLGALMSLVGVTLFFATDAHLALIQLASDSIDVFPLGQLPTLNNPMRPLLAAGSMYSLGLAFAAPVAMALLLADLVIGVASRNLPQVNVLVLAMPIKVLIGYFVLALSVRGWASMMRHGIGRMIDVFGVR